MDFDVDLRSVVGEHLKAGLMDDKLVVRLKGRNGASKHDVLGIHWTTVVHHDFADDAKLRSVTVKTRVCHIDPADHGRPFRARCEVDPDVLLDPEILRYSVVRGRAPSRWGEEQVGDCEGGGARSRVVPIREDDDSEA